MLYCWSCNDFASADYNRYRDDMPSCSSCGQAEIDEYANCVLCGGDIKHSDDYTPRDGGLAHDGCIAGELERAKRDADEYAADKQYDTWRDAKLEQADMARLTAKER